MRVKTYIPGGLGNQLFSFTAGLFYAKKFSGTLELNLRYLDRKHGRENFLDLIGATTESLASNNILLDDSNVSSSYLNDLINANIRRLKLGKLLYPRTGFIFEEDYTYPGQKAKIDDAFQYLVMTRRRIREVRLYGYFQDMAYLNETKSMFGINHPLDLLCNFSDSINHELYNLKNLEPFCAVHIRLGDYRTSLSQSYGILSPSYYAEGMKRITEKKPNLKFKIFSDEIELASKIYRELESDNVTWVGLEKDSNSGTTLNEFSEMLSATDFVLGNSTYGIWAALLTRNLDSVFYPWPMYRNSKSMGILSIPRDWTAIKSQFQ